jgi:hypothetical protein
VNEDLLSISLYLSLSWSVARKSSGRLGTQPFTSGFWRNGHFRRAHMSWDAANQPHCNATYQPEQFTHFCTHQFRRVSKAPATDQPTGQFSMPQQNWKCMHMPKLRHRRSQLKRPTRLRGRMDAKEVLAASGNRGGAIGLSSGGRGVPVQRRECRMLREVLEILRTKYACTPESEISTVFCSE